MLSRISSGTPWHDADRAGDRVAGDSRSREGQLLRLQQAAIESAANAIVIADVKGIIQWTNPAFTALTGYTAAEARGRTPALLKSGEHAPSFYADLWRTILAGQTWRGEFTNRRKNGTLYHGEQVITPVRGDGGDITHFVAVMNDVTARRHAEAARRDAHRQLQHLLDHSPAVIYGLKWERQRIVPHTVSENIARLLGFAATETLSHEWWLKQLHPADRERAEASFGETLAQETSRTEYRLRHRNGSYRWIEDERRLIRDAAGQPAEFIGVWTDITERKHAEEVLRDTAIGRPKQQARRLAIELAVMAAIAVAVFAGENIFGWFEPAFRLLADQVTHPLADETTLMVGFMTLAMAVFSIRRWRESRAEAVTQHNLAAALNTLRAELEGRVRQRTAELARANEGLRAEIVQRSRANEALWQSEERYRALVDTAPTGIFVNADDRFAYVNATMCRIFGATSPEELLGKVTLERIHPDSRAAVLERIARGRAGQSAPLMDHRYLRLDGSVVDVETVATPISFHGQRAIQVVVNDVTQRRRAEGELQESEQRFHDMLANVELIAMTLDARGFVTFCNDYLLRLTGWQRDEVVGADWMMKFLPESESAVRNLFFATIEAGFIPAHHENAIKTRTGELREIAWNNTILRDATGKIVGTASIGEDVTDRKRAAALLQRAKEQYQSIFQHSTEGIYQTSPAGRILAANPAMARILGFASPEELTAERCDIARQGYVDPARREEFKRGIEQEGVVTDFEYEVYRKDGSRVWVSENARVVRAANGTILCYEGSMVDVTERKRAEARLALQFAVTEVLAESDSQERAIQRILETIGRSLRWDAGELWMVDRSAKALRCTQTWSPVTSEFSNFLAASRQLTLARGVGLAGGVWAEGQEAWIADVSQQADCPRREMLTRSGLCSWVGFPIKLRKEVVGVVGFFSRGRREADPEMAATLGALGNQLGQFIEREQLAEQFRQAQKMEALGTLAGGVAHDFNNIIAGISGYTELARMDKTLGKETASHLAAVLQCSARAASLVKQILAFSRHQDHKRHPIQLRHIVREALHLLRATIPTTIAFDSHCEHDLPAVLADANQIHQIVMNLGSNAWHAMRDRPGKLGVTLEAFAVDASVAELHPGLRVGRYVRLSVSDTGRGMDRGTMARIFDPFFTTKGPGEGTGLGLAVVHGIMLSHDGVITVYSQPGEGTLFHLYFPACESATETPDDADGPVPKGHGERVLYVDDEELLARMTCRALEQLGYTADYKTDSTAALDAVRREPGRYALVITDLTMPVLTGTALADELQKVRPDLPIVLVTGYAASLSAGQVRALGIQEFLLKPHSVQSLGHAVSRALAGPKTN